MTDLSADDKNALNELAFYMLKEAYTASVQAFVRSDAEAARKLIDGVETILTAAVQAMHSAETEGPRSREIALALGSKLMGVFESAHHLPAVVRTPEAVASAPTDLLAGRQAFAFFATLKAA
ncbi:hypothetical protein ASG52_19745 [Methylobacterium sp. Leaf456]|uniref:hypothetical protein n=1 Tax=Methylobacterium sp. Leaf456 TaxID=1736382 RepID=UPI0006FD4CFB|nr:hypothetical protein [Methylobacterium sp. Leaf456]KQT59961.1 hypothetical protein ASG52_19745 [Methylobacterium sp. Leaf456]